MKQVTSNNKVALVFGGSRGIGAAAVRRLAKDGFAVGLTYVSRPDSAEEMVAEVMANGGQALAIKADSADAEAIQQAVQQLVSHFGRLDVVVVNAGLLRLGQIDSFTVEALDEILSVNIRGVYLAIQAAVARMGDNGRVITIGSNSAVRPLTPIGTVYGMSKAAVAAMIKGLALDLAPRGIRVNNIQPGPIETDMTIDQIDMIRGMVPLKQVGQPNDIAELVSYLASEESRYMTGASLTIDGGMSL
ncbi:3-oxoacyl-ACP reductase family protein [Gallaecimonas pentaromativorans]|uniref:3-oxoacyl-[acyl-carrier protein] reductase n=1 Tax=Gallaecimonas pentaromativorans TaxID=584787 RepID=A0A3N1PIK9_9GAMM|nr:3-oxoacyl-ACP reductase family protein [Gallaecimonas pentaromativorans]ROQ27668.1 3-oxoacyl-[acyl-carrier protein] reductase [Gallaecimonas pentaromativorans]